MNTTIVSPVSRRMSIAGYNFKLQELEKSNVQKQSLDEELKRKAIEQNILSSQSNINILCHDIQGEYHSMVKTGKDTKKLQDELLAKKKEEELFYKTADTTYLLEKVDESLLTNMKNRRLAYYALPISDCIFAFLALYPILTSKFLTSFNALAICFPITLLMGLLLSLLSRLAASCRDENNSKQGIEVFLAASILPLMYIVGEIVFFGGQRWAYSAIFAIASFTIQLIIIKGYKQQAAAMEYFRKREEYVKEKQLKQADEQAIRNEISSIKSNIQGLISSFEQSLGNFTNMFMDLAIARDEHIKKFETAPKIYLNQMIIYFGDLVCFRDERIPLNYEQDGKISCVPLVEFPYAPGVRNIFLNEDYVILDYMMKYSPSSISLSETLNMLEEQRKKELVNPSTPSDTPDTKENEQTSSQTEVDDDGPMWE